MSHYTSNVVVTSVANDKTLVPWSGRFKRKNLGDDPPDDDHGKTAVDAITGVYRSGLNNLEKMVESR